MRGNKTREASCGGGQFVACDELPASGKHSAESLVSLGLSCLLGGRQVVAWDDLPDSGKRSAESLASPWVALPLGWQAACRE